MRNVSIRGWKCLMYIRHGWLLHYFCICIYPYFFCLKMDDGSREYHINIIYTKPQRSPHRPTQNPPIVKLQDASNL
jgi:hypothetical protein